jgi:hypothetical protein
MTFPSGYSFVRILVRRPDICLGLILLFSGFVACRRNSSGAGSEDNRPLITLPNTDSTRRKTGLETLLQGFPSPVQITRSLKRLNLGFEASLINPADNSRTYNIIASAALNIGVYGTDLSYALLHNQTQEATESFQAQQRLAEHLELLSFFQTDLFNRVQANRHQTDSVLAILSNQYMRMNHFLTQTGQEDVGRLIVVGAWIEAIYLSTELWKRTPHTEMQSRLAEQKPAIRFLIERIEPYKEHHHFTDLYFGLREIEKVFDAHKGGYGYEGTFFNPDRKMYYIRNYRTAPLSTTEMQTLSTKIAELRKQITR